MSCAYCEKARTDWTFGGLHADCPGCVVRDLARCPPMIREASYLQAPPEERATLVAAVNAERRRIRDLRAQTE